MKKIIIYILIIILSSCHTKNMTKSKKIKKMEVNSETHDVELDGVSDHYDIEVDELKKYTSVTSSGGSGIKKSMSIENKKVKIVTKKNNNLKKETNEIKIGHVLYQTPDTMIVLVESKVIVRISKDKSIDNTLDGISGKVNVVPINVTDKMEVKLVDPSPDNDPSFSVKSVNKSEQEVDGETYTEWEFTVVPLRKGKHELKLVISIFRDGKSKEQVWSDTIQVKANTPKRILTFWEKYWQYLMSTFIIPIFVFFWKRRKKED